MTLPKIDQKPGGTRSYHGGHGFNTETENMVMHARFNTRYTKDGEKVFFLEEIQSDLHQKANIYDESEMDYLRRLRRYAEDPSSYEIEPNDAVSDLGVKPLGPGAEKWAVKIVEKGTGRARKVKAPPEDQPDNVGEIITTEMGSPIRVGTKFRMEREDTMILNVGNRSRLYERFLEETGQQQIIHRIPRQPNIFGQEARMVGEEGEMRLVDPDQMTIFDVDFDAIAAEEVEATKQQIRDFVSWAVGRVLANQESILRQVPREGRRMDGRDADGWITINRIEGDVGKFPFKKTWDELLLKRLVRWAAQKGYDRFAWTHAREQGMRYGSTYYERHPDWNRQKDAVVVKVWYDRADGETKFFDGSGHRVHNGFFPDRNELESNLDSYLSPEAKAAVLDKIFGPDPDSDANQDLLDELREEFSVDVFEEYNQRWVVQSESGDYDYYSNESDADYEADRLNNDLAAEYAGQKMNEQEQLIEDEELDPDDAHDEDYFESEWWEGFHNGDIDGYRAYDTYDLDEIYIKYTIYDASGDPVMDQYGDQRVYESEDEGYEALDEYVEELVRERGVGSGNVTIDIDESQWRIPEQDEDRPKFEYVLRAEEGQADARPFVTRYEELTKNVLGRIARKQGKTNLEMLDVGAIEDVRVRVKFYTRALMEQTTDETGRPIVTFDVPDGSSQVPYQSSNFENEYEAARWMSQFVPPKRLSDEAIDRYEYMGMTRRSMDDWLAQTPLSTRGYNEEGVAGSSINSQAHIMARWIKKDGEEGYWRMAVLGRGHHLETVEQRRQFRESMSSQNPDDFRFFIWHRDDDSVPMNTSYTQSAFREAGKSEPFRSGPWPSFKITDELKNSVLLKEKIPLFSLTAPNKNVRVQQQVVRDETGDTVTIEADSDQLLRWADKRLSNLQSLMECIG